MLTPPISFFCFIYKRLLSKIHRLLLSFGEYDHFCRYDISMSTPECQVSELGNGIVIIVLHTNMLERCGIYAYHKKYFVIVILLKKLLGY
jgi:hypothetical protein